MGLVLLTAAVAFTPTIVAAAEDPEVSISPIGFNIVDGKQDIDNPIENPELLTAPGYSSTSSSLGTHWSVERIIDDDDREQVEDTTKAPYRWVGRIDFINGNGRKAQCTGALVANNTVLTAGHCFNQGASNITFRPGLNADTDHFPTANATQVWYDKTPNQLGTDWAVMKLDKPVGNEVGWFAMTTPSDETLNGAQATVIGYPGDKPAGTMWQDRNEVVEFTSNFIKYLTDTFLGQSGAPVVDDNATIYGIHNGAAGYNGGQRITTDLFSVVVNISTLDQ